MAYCKLHGRCSLKTSRKPRSKIPVPESLFTIVAGIRSATLLKKRLGHRCFPVNFAKYLRIPFLENTSGLLLLDIGMPPIITLILSGKPEKPIVI